MHPTYHSPKGRTTPALLSLALILILTTPSIAEARPSRRSILNSTRSYGNYRQPVQDSAPKPGEWIDYDDYLTGAHIEYPDTWDMRILTSDERRAVGSPAQSMTVFVSQAHHMWLAYGAKALATTADLTALQADFDRYIAQPDPLKKVIGSSQLEYLRSVEVLESKVVMIDGVQALKHVFTRLQDGRVVKVIQVRVPQGNRIVILEFMAEQTWFDRYASLMDSYTDTFSFIRNRQSARYRRSQPVLSTRPESKSELWVPRATVPSRLDRMQQRRQKRLERRRLRHSGL